MKKKDYIIVFVLLGVFASCKDPAWEAEVPTYLLIDSFQLQTTAEEGSNSHDIRDVWVYDNNNLLGAYPLPAEIPLLGKEEKMLVVYPGIRENGNSFYPDIYFLYEPDTFFIDPTEDNEFKKTGNTLYDERTKFAFVENFESGNIFTESITSLYTSSVQVVSDTVFEGDKGGMMEVTEDFTPVVVGTENAYGPFFQDGRQLYLEMDFKSEVPLTIGYAGISFEGEPRDFLKVTLKPTTEWRKVYIEFTEEFSGDDIFRAQMILRADLDGRYTTDSVGRAYFDNIKLVHF
jgi:hypothetical protein